MASVIKYSSQANCLCRGSSDVLAAWIFDVSLENGYDLYPEEEQPRPQDCCPLGQIVFKRFWNVYLLPS